ncbi:ABC transporter ATP-binding protein [Actinomadura verrucosospora]|uniref:Oligopeptide ABC transporter ATP-binding protein n=1 Tax=Actinomadura verrucosospora TaxID=46165 RepID=A0A7D3ZGB7_ACTVE|nr:ABC transporter ATP-binding protein [Actinomadura verrucosospora]QKG22937.1 oligopeptide ABC transporter ATP-binding protein [Actinomadura verrucosospora]
MVTAGLTVTGLTADVPGRRVVHGVDLAVPAGRVLALVGPSGSGKTLTARAVAGLHPHGGTVLVDGRPPVRGRDVGYAFQDALASLNPTVTVRRHLTETVKAHGTGDPAAALARFGLDPALAAAHPFELSGGQAQRVALALATVHEPPVLIADEVTTALDPVTQATVLDLVRAQARDRAVLLITHDLTAAARWADDIAVMRDGRIVEHGPAERILGEPESDLARELVAAATAEVPADGPAAAVAEGEAVAVRGLRRVLRSRRRTTVALDGADLAVRPGEAVAIVGRSGSGKSTLVGALAALDRPDGGSVLRAGADVWALRDRERRAVRRRTGLVFQDPLASFDPRHTVRQAIAEAGPYDDDLLRYVGLDPAMAARRPGTLSGGECQRVAIARALAQKPDVLLADEPTSGLDVLTEERVLRLLTALRRDHGITIALVTHDLRVARRVADRVVVLHAGRIVEDLPAHALDSASHPETRRLLDATALTGKWA